MKTDPIIEKAIDYLHTGWTQGLMAVDHAGESCDEKDPKAVAWCFTGALRAAMEDLGYDIATKEGWRTLGAVCYRVAFAGGFADDDIDNNIISAVESWNDQEDRTTEDVILTAKMALADGMA